MRSLLRDLGAQDAIYGPDFQFDGDPSDPRHLLHQVRLWAWQRTQGYFSVDHRERVLREYVDSMLLPQERLPSPTEPDDPGLPYLAPSPFLGVPQPADRKPLPDSECVISLSSGSWRCRRAPHGAVLFFSEADGAIRMLGDHSAETTDPILDLANRAVHRIFRRWWRAPSGLLHRIDRQGSRMAVVSSLPRGTLWPEEHVKAVLLGPGAGGEEGLPWEGLGLATDSQLNETFGLA